MHDDALKAMWRAQNIGPTPKLSDAEQIAAMQSKMKGLDRTLFWRDLRESIAGLFVMVCFSVYFFVFTAPMARVGSGIVVLSSLVATVYPIWRKRRVVKAEPDASLAEMLKGELRKLDVEIALLRSVFWWYIFPLSVGVIVFFGGITGSLSASMIWGVAMMALDAIIYWVNQIACDKRLIPLKRELEALLPAEGIGPAVVEKRPRYVVPMFMALLGIGFGLIAVEAQRRGGTDELKAPGFGNVSALTTNDVAQIDEWLRQQVLLANFPSLSVAIVRDGEIAHMKSYGFEDYKTSKIAGPKTVYHVASVTKAFTATVAMILHERGVINLDAPAAKYLPSGVAISATPERGAKITVRQLASHTSGLPRGVPGAVQSVEGRYALEPERLYAHLGKVKLESEPGTRELYSNLGFGLLGHVLERAAGKPYEQLVSELVCEPLQLERTAIDGSKKLEAATGYSSSRARTPEGQSYKERLAGSGGLAASVEDLAKFVGAQMKSGVFSSNALAQLHTPTKLADGSAARTALGWSIRTNKVVGRIVEKNGGRNNAGAWIGFAPEHGVGVVVATNCGDPSVDPIGRWLLERLVSTARVNTGEPALPTKTP